MGHKELQTNLWNIIPETEISGKIPIEIVGARESFKNPFPPKIILISTHLLGEHEKYDERNLQTVNFKEKQGWAGPPIAIGHYSTDQAIHDLSGLTVITDEEYGDWGALDGHHRLEKSKKEGILWVPAVAMPSRNERVICGRWGEKGPMIMKSNVFEKFKQEDEVYPPQTTKWQILGLDEKLHKVVDMVPDFFIPTEFLKTPLKQLLNS